MELTSQNQPETLSYPLGRYKPPAAINGTQREIWIDEIAALPENLRQAVEGLADWLIDTPYRPGGWTVRQVVHHLPDSHMNSYVRFKLALTQPTPTINAYDESAWAEMKDAKTAPINLSITLLDSLHARWVMLLRSLEDDEYQCVFIHPERGPVRLDWALGLYAWHSRHHVAHIENLRMREGWKKNGEAV